MKILFSLLKWDTFVLNKEGNFLKLKQKFNNKRAQSRWFRILTNKYSLATLVFLSLLFFLSDNGLVRLLRKHWELRQQRQLIEWYDQEIFRLDRRLEELTENRDSIERLARENYFFQEPDEVVYLVVDED